MWTRKEKWKLIKDSRDDAEKEFSMHEESQEENDHVEIECELLVGESKDKLYKTRHESQVECYLKFDETIHDTMHDTDKEFYEDAREVHVEKKWS